MFLRKENLPIRGESIVLSELSALQRLEYFEYLSSLEASLPEDAFGLKQQALQMKINLNVNAWLISRSLWHETPDQDVDEIQQKVVRTWPSEAMNLAVEKILTLSDMLPQVPEDEEPKPELEGSESPVQDKPLAK